MIGLTIVKQGNHFVTSDLILGIFLQKMKAFEKKLKENENERSKNPKEKSAFEANFSKNTSINQCPGTT